MKCKIKLDLNYLKYCFDIDCIEHEYGKSLENWVPVEPIKITSISFNVKHLSEELIFKINSLRRSPSPFTNMIKDIDITDNVIICQD